MTEHRHGDADRGDQQHEGERHPSTAAAEQLRSRLRRDHAVDCEPAHGEKKRKRGAEVGPVVAEDAAREHDLGLARARACVAEQAEDECRRDRAYGRRGEPVPDAEPVVGRQQAGSEKACVVDERTRPKKRELARGAVALSCRDRLDPVRLDPAEGIRLRLSSGDIAHDLPPLALPSSGSCGRRIGALSARPCPWLGGELPRRIDLTG